jgi:rfaE bifunctional protein kinase chain/domain
VNDHLPLGDLVTRFPQARVVLVGDLVLDRFILGTPKRISREAPVIILRFEGQRDIPGGGANALANLAALGVQTLPVGAVGDDDPGLALLAGLQQLGVDTAGIVRVPGYRTPVKVRILGGGPSSLKHQVARYDVEDELPPDGTWRVELRASLRRAVRRADAVAVSDYGYGAVDADILSELLAPDLRPPWVCLDSRHRLTELRGVDGATPNLQELETCAGRPLHTDEQVAAAAAALCIELGARFVLATRGHRGMTLAERDLAPRHIPVYGTDQVADVTGAGDTVLAVLTAALAVGATPARAARLANLAGGIVVMKLGTAAVSRDELAHAARQAAAEDGPP